MYKLTYTKTFQKDLTQIRRNPALYETLKDLVVVLPENPFLGAEKLEPKFRNLYSKRINIQHRLVYKVDKETQTVKLLACWTHYE